MKPFTKYALPPAVNASLPGNGGRGLKPAL